MQRNKMKETVDKGDDEDEEDAWMPGCSDELRRTLGQIEAAWADLTCGHRWIFVEMVSVEFQHSHRVSYDDVVHA